MQAMNENRTEWRGGIVKEIKRKQKKGVDYVIKFISCFLTTTATIQNCHTQKRKKKFRTFNKFFFYNNFYDDANRFLSKEPFKEFFFFN